MDIQSFYKQHSSSIDNFTEKDWRIVFKYTASLHVQTLQTIETSEQNTENTSHILSAYRQLISAYLIIQLHFSTKGDTEASDKLGNMILALKKSANKAASLHTHSDSQETLSLSDARRCSL